MHAAVVCRFGPFELDPASGQLFREGKRAHLSGPQSAILTYLICHAGMLVSKNTLIHVGWAGASVGDDNLKQVIMRLRRLLADGQSDGTYIETIGHQGYRFVAVVQQIVRQVAGPLDAQLAPFRAFMQGQIAIDSLELDQIQLAQRTYEDVLRAEPELAAAHTRLAMACGLAFDATTLDATQDVASLERGIQHAHKGCELDPTSGEAWSTLAFVLYLHGDARDAAAAACKATMLEPEDGRHALSTARVSWGGDRLRAAARALTMGAGTALPHWLRGTVLIARGTFPAAFEEVRLGCAAQDAQIKGVGFPAVGLHLQHALLLGAHGLLDEAVAALQRELTWANSGQVYARECAANTCYTLGAIYWRSRSGQTHNMRSRRP
jgi:DNA-binding winged helix-turn-helix (wHTH) protein